MAELPSCDLEGNPRVQGGAIDIGAFESPESFTPVDLETAPLRLYVLESGNPKGPGTSWEEAFDSVGRASLFAFGPTEIWVEEGHYDESFFVETPTHLHGGFRGFEADVGERETDFRRSVLDGAGKGTSVLQFFSTRDNLVDGFRIEGGEADGGGGALVEYSELILANCEVADNTATESGGGIHIQTSSVFIIGSQIRENAAGSQGGNETGFGGGVYTAHSPIRLVDSLIEGNRTYGFSAEGGGLHANRGLVELFGVSIRGNESDGDGGAVLGTSPNLLELDRCVIANNRAGDGAGGIGVHGGRTFIRNTVVWKNAGEMHGGFEGRDSSGLTIENSTFYGNAPNNATFNRRSGSVAVEVRNSVFWRGVSSNFDATDAPVFYSNIEGGWPGTGNLDLDPLFIAPEKGDFRLAAGSPCIDSGTVEGPAIDFEGRPRPVDIPGTGRDGTGGEYDMGAFERPAIGYFDTLADEDRDGWVGPIDLLESLETGFDEKPAVPSLFYYALLWRRDVSTSTLLESSQR